MRDTRIARVWEGMYRAASRNRHATHAASLPQIVRAACADLPASRGVSTWPGCRPPDSGRAYFSSSAELTGSPEAVVME